MAGKTAFDTKTRKKSVSKFGYKIPDSKAGRASISDTKGRVLHGDGVTDFGEWMKDRLRKLRCEQRDLARSLGVSEGTISKLVRGQRKWTLAEVWKATRFLEVDLETFFKAMGFR